MRSHCRQQQSVKQVSPTKVNGELYQSKFANEFYSFREIQHLLFMTQHNVGPVPRTFTRHSSGYCYDKDPFLIRQIFTFNFNQDSGPSLFKNESIPVNEYISI